MRSLVSSAYGNFRFIGSGMKIVCDFESLPYGVDTVARTCTPKSLLLGNRWLPQAFALCRMFRPSSAAVATMREGHRSPRRGPAVRHRQWGRGPAYMSRDRRQEEKTVHLALS